MNDIREDILHLIEHLEHVLPAQAPIKDFVHHNTLHGYQHLDFPQALIESEEITGAKGYLSHDKFRELFSQGRINLDNLSDVLTEDVALNHPLVANLDQLIFSHDSITITHKDIILNNLIHPLKAISNAQLSWQIEELAALEKFQEDVNQQQRDKILQATSKDSSTHDLKTNEALSMSSLWQETLACLNLEHFIVHPEEMMDLSPDQAELVLSQEIAQDLNDTENSQTHRQVRKESRQILSFLLDSVGKNITLSGFIKAITGIDIMDDIKPVILKYTSAFLDQGMAAWHHQDHHLGFYQSWKKSAHEDLAWFFEELDDWNDRIDSLPDDAMDTIISELQLQGIAKERWCDYLQRLSLDLPGWSGMFLWRHCNPGYEANENPVSMLDYMAVRLVLERLFAQRVCSQIWRTEANLDTLRYYFRRRSSDFLVRYTLYHESLPEYLATLAARQVERAKTDFTDYKQWENLANMIWTWQHSPQGNGALSEKLATKTINYRVSQHAWPLFRLFQHLGLNANDVAKFDAKGIKTIFSLLEQMDENTASYIWLRAYELNYHEHYFNTLQNNEGRGRWKQRNDCPDAQLVFCMDDREEGIRRHLEELNPNIETFGAAAFFGLPINWQGIDDEQVTALCPVVVDPTHVLKEVPLEDQQSKLAEHHKRRNLRLKIKSLIHQETRRGLLSSLFLIFCIAPISLLSLIGKTFFPRALGEFSEKYRDKFDLLVSTKVDVNCQQPKSEPTPDDQQVGYSDSEQADKIEGFLRLIGLVNGFSPFIVMVGHGSISQNNPHIAAYDCGACSGRHSGPNARSFAAMANRPEIRAILKERGLDIGEATWFLGAEHNTCDEKLTWYDSELIPEHLATAFVELKNTVYESSKFSAHERCRRLASAPKNPTNDQALKHIVGRSYDYSQARPELGHATNAICFIGRRSATQGAFFDRRIFLISYDPTTDLEGEILERILLAAGPVGAGINLEYYFSTVDNERYGSGSKITHNVNGNFGVMDGATGDLRTGLPKQMIEIHEAMRLQIVVEHSEEVLTRIYTAQPIIQELVGKGWILLSIKDPDSAEIKVFKPSIGFVKWQGKKEKLPKVERSLQWYQGQSEALNLALINQPQHSTVRGRQNHNPEAKDSLENKKNSSIDAGATV